MNMVKPSPHLYNQRYPHYLGEQNLVWVVKVGDRICIEGRSYKISSVTRSAVPGMQPQIELSPLDLTSD